MSNTNNTSSGGIGFLGLLAIVFITLKLCGVIAWSWWWVTAPLWGGLVLILGILALVALGALIACLWPSKRRR